MRFRGTLLATSMLVLPLAAQAQPVTGLYVAAGAGVNWHGDTNDRVTIAPPFFADGARLRVTSSPGFAGVMSVGWGFGNGLRIELEGNLRHNDVNDVRITTYDGFTSNAAQRSGYIRTYGAMVNALYDFRIGPVMPYLGLGVGYAWHRWENVGGIDRAFGDTVRITNTAGGFAYQGIAGLAIPIAAIPGLSVTAEYRYFASMAGRLSGTYALTGEGGAPARRATVKPDNQNHSLLIGVRYNFGQVPRAVVAQQRPDPARSFLVFFDFGRAELTPRAREIIAQAAAASRTQQATRIEVSGHADRAGTPQYNQGLSQRRANNVASELVRLGVPRGAIAVAAFGESRPLVPTEDGVREPQNRRVEIIFR